MMFLREVEVMMMTSMKSSIGAAFAFAAMVAGAGSPAQAEIQSPPQENSPAKAVDSPTYVEEYQAISVVLNKYVEGCKQAKSSIMKPAFSPQATMYSVGADGKLTGGAIPILFNGVDKNFRPSPDAKAAIVRIEIVGTAASARIDANDVSGISFTDFFQLLKVEGKWTVISKIFYTHPA